MLICSVCGNLAGELSQPEVPHELQGFLKPLFKLASLKYGPIDIPKSGNFLEAVDPDVLSKFLGIKCATCSAFSVMVPR